VRAWHPGTCAWLDDDDGQTNVVHRKFTMQARIVKRMVETGRWEGPLDRDIEMMCRDNPGKEINFLHIVMPSDEVYGSDGKKMRDLRHPFVSCYIDVDHRQKMHESGEPLMPYMAPRWRRLSGFNFGFSPAAMNSLPDARMLQDMARVILEQGEKAVDPPIIGAGEVFTRDMNLYAGGFTYVDMPAGAKLGDLMTTVETSEGLRTGVELKQDVRALITEAFLLNKLYLPGAREMRELEVAVRTEEFRRAALPFFTPIESEYHTPLLGKVFDRAVLMGLIPREMFPEELTDEEVRFTFHSPLNEAEGKAMVESFNIMMQTVAASAQVDETVANIINIREATRDAVRGGGAKATWLLSEKEMKKKDVEAEQVQQLRQGAQIAREGAGVVSDVSNAAMAAEQAGLLPQ
jgi:hypothetical protein